MDYKNFLIYHIHDKALRHLASKYLSGILLDIGCGEKPYSKLLSGIVDKHVGVDHIDTQHDKSFIDLYGTAYSIPVEDEAFDSVLCTAVLEHLEEPNIAVKETFRVLKQGGVAIYSVPFFWYLHEESRDFYRFTKYGLEHLFRSNGFQVIVIKPLSGFWVTFGTMFGYYLKRFNKSVLRYTFIVPIIIILLKLFTYFLNKLDKAESWTWMYMVVVKKNKNMSSFSEGLECVV